MATANSSEGQALRDAIASLQTAISHTHATGESAELVKDTSQAATSAAVTSSASSAATVAAIDAATNALIRLEAAMTNRRCPTAAN